LSCVTENTFFLYVRRYVVQILPRMLSHATNL
jgi:hypothetical protein